jgi:adenosine deaminase
MKTLDDIIRTMPKIELHCHLEGAFTLEFLLDRIHTYEPESDIRDIETLKQQFVFDDFDHFIRVWVWKNRFFRTADDFRNSTYHAIEALVKQNIIALEAFFSPWDFEEWGPGPEAIIEATLEGKEAAEKDFGIPVNLITDLVRNHGHEKAEERLKQLYPYKDRICGIGLGGDEKHYPAFRFEDVFQLARSKGFHTMVHAGETEGPYSIWDAVSRLNAERIGHGITAIQNRELMNILRDRQIPLEICPTSNLKTRVIKSPKEHPVRKFYDAGLLITINTDDPTMFNQSLIEEFQFICDQYDFTADDLERLAHYALKASFFPPDIKLKLQKIIDPFWDKLNQ